MDAAERHSDQNMRTAMLLRSPASSPTAAGAKAPPLFGASAVAAACLAPQPAPGASSPASATQAYAPCAAAPAPATPAADGNLRTAMLLAERTSRDDGGLLRTAMLPCSPGSPGAPQKSANGPAGFPVLLQIYDVSQEQSIQRVNRVLAHRLSPLKFGGVFHAGVEVNGLEWSFGLTPSVEYPGVTSVKPMTHPQHHFRQSVGMGLTKLSGESIKAIIAEMVVEYPGPSYDLLRRNCCNFADDFCQRLGLGRIPGWVHRLARMGARIDGVLGVQQRVASREHSRREHQGGIASASGSSASGRASHPASGSLSRGGA